MTQESVIWSERHVLLTDADAAVMGPHTEWTAWIGDARLSILESEAGDLICATVAPPAGSEHEWSLTPADGTHDLMETKAIAERVARALLGESLLDPGTMNDADLEAWRSWAFDKVGPKRRCDDLREAIDGLCRKEGRPPPIGIVATAGHSPDCVCSQCETGSDGCRGDKRLRGLVHRYKALLAKAKEKEDSP